jgi:hypothetical protein
VLRADRMQPPASASPMVAQAEENPSSANAAHRKTMISSLPAKARRRSLYFLVFVAALCFGILYVSGGGTASLALFTESVGVFITIFVVNEIIKAEWEIKEHPVRKIAYESARRAFHALEQDWTTFVRWGIGDTKELACLDTNVTTIFDEKLLVFASHVDFLKIAIEPLAQDRAKYLEQRIVSLDLALQNAEVNCRNYAPSDLVYTINQIRKENLLHQWRIAHSVLALINIEDRERQRYFFNGKENMLRSFLANMINLRLALGNLADDLGEQDSFSQTESMLTKRLQAVQYSLRERRQELESV